MLVGAAAVWISPKKYEATVVVSPQTGTSNSGELSSLGSAASQLGGIASLAGLSLGGNSAKAESIATLQSEALTERYIQENGLLPTLFPRKWDSQKNNWKTSDESKIPTLWQGNRLFDDKLRRVKENSRNGLVTLGITWTDSKIAASWANGLVKLTNEYLRDKAIKESEKNIAYLNEEALKTSVVRTRDSIYSLMESEIRKEMLARGSDEYALKIIDPAVAPEKPSSPQPVLWILAALCIGLLLSSTYIFFRLLLTATKA
jgi:hypothetical protein